MGRRIGTLALGLLIACSTGLAGRSNAITARAPEPIPVVHVRKQNGEQIVRVALTGGATPRVSATGEWDLLAPDGRALLARGFANEPWRFERNGRQVRAVRSDGEPTEWEQRSIVARVTSDGAFITLDGKRYRGEFRIVATDTGLMVVNRLTVEQYVRGVVPLEMGQRTLKDLAAVQAQAVTARSYAFAHLADDPDRAYDLTGGVLDQVYGGVDVEELVSSTAIESTAGLVLAFAGRVVNAPYHATCGGSTAEAPEVWRTPGEPYLQRVSDRIPGTDRYYCDIAPRFTWTSTLSAAQLNEVVTRYLKLYTTVPGGQPGIVRGLAVTGHTPSGRVASLDVRTDRGTFTLHGNDIRFVLRTPNGELLNSTYFSLTTETNRDGALVRAVLQGKGYGHGVGMCQWGAIGRARAGQDFRTILRAYYPGTTVGMAD